MDHGELGRRRIAETLRASPVFADVPSRVVEALAADVGEIRLTDGQPLFQAGDSGDAMFLVLAGAVDVLSRPRNGEKNGQPVARIHPGEPVGEMALLVGGPRSAGARAVGTTRLARIPAGIFNQATRYAPRLRTALEDEITRRYKQNRLAGVIETCFAGLDAAEQAGLVDSLDWYDLKPGELLFDRGEPADSLYILVNGQLRVLDGDPDQGYRPIATLGPREMVGEMGVLKDRPRSARVVATHASSLVRLSRARFEALSRRHPALSLEVTRQVADRLDRAQQVKRPAPAVPRSIAVVRADPGGSSRHFLKQLSAALPPDARALTLDPSEITTRLGRESIAHAGPGDPAYLGLGLWLDEREAEQDLVFYLTDPPDGDGHPSGWTRRCLERADAILVLADSRENPALTRLERAVYRHLDRRRQAGAAPMVHLALLHPATAELPGRTAHWLADRRVDAHHHVRMGDPDHMARLGRRLTGRAVGVALSGGGARGIAHIGILRALDEARVPVDLVAGTSIGGVIGALYARGMATDDILAQAEWAFVTSQPFREYTLPRYSLVRSRRLDRVCRGTYGDIQVEDLWRNFHCISTNITRQVPRLHDRGPLWRAVRATGAIPGLTTPVIIDGEIHVDGGVLDNLPGDGLRGRVARLITLDVRAERGLTAQHAEFPSPWAPLWRRLRPGRRDEAESAPNIMEILMDSVLAASDQAARRVLAESDVVFAPPLGTITTLQFRELKRIEQMGYDYARGMLDAVGTEALCQAPAVMRS